MREVKVVFENTNRGLGKYRLIPICFYDGKNINIKETVSVYDSDNFVFTGKKRRYHVIKYNLPDFVDFKTFYKSKYIFDLLNFDISIDTFSKLIAMPKSFIESTLNTVKNEEDLLTRMSEYKKASNKYSFRVSNTGVSTATTITYHDGSRSIYDTI